MRLALFSPLSPLRTAIADHVEGLLPYLAEFAHIDLYIDDGYTPSNPAIANNYGVYNHRQFPELVSQYDAAIYHMGDEPVFHGYIYKMLQQHKGIVVLHDLVLHHCIGGLTWARGDTDGYLAEMRYAYGKEGEAAAQQIMSGRRLDWMYKYPLVERVLDNNIGLVVHNGSAHRQVLERRPGLAVTFIPQHFFLPAGVSPDDDVSSLRQALSLEDRFVVGTYGLLMEVKQLDLTLRAFARFRHSHPRSVYLLVGPPGRDYDLAGLVHRMGLEDSVRMVGWQSSTSFVRHMLASDVAIQLRHPHVGGTPYTPIRLMGLGIPTIVSDIEPLAEIPEGCCAKIGVDEYEEDTLLATMEFLATHDGARREMAERGRSHIQAEHHPRVIAHKYKAFIEDLLSAPEETVEKGPVTWEQNLIGQVAATLADWGVRSEDDALLLPIAAAIASLGIGSPESGGSA